MADSTGISWTDHTHNPWWGCVTVSPACENCYASTFAARFGVRWGMKEARRPASDSVWAAPIKWDRAAKKAGRKARVFCASMADVFEDRRDLDVHRTRLFDLILATPHLDWQLLTKRPHAIMRLIPSAWRAALPDNVWIGTTVEDQRRAVERIPILLDVPAVVRFVSCEPLLGALDLRAWLGNDRVSWVISGGESGHGSRPMAPEWVRSLREQCDESGVAYWFKQWGEFITREQAPATVELPKRVHHISEVDYYRVGKHIAGELLDGVVRQAFPVGHDGPRVNAM